ncbi:hypothetical protein LWI29_025395 [Acer saccharum]|uniref:Uncharacterized protein n=1 Tax=Acer saccharum TaxID=4024 RepID=A0AA39TDQ0_ACESA|nr:hypothetical protein LWI29_025395 [Acer saccharum]
MKLAEDINLVDMVWLENFLALRKYHKVADRNLFPDKETFQIYWPKGVGLGEVFSRSAPQESMFQRFRRETCQGQTTGKTSKRRLLGQSKLDKRARGLLVNRLLDKGKKKLTNKAKEKSKSYMVQNSKLVLEKRTEDKKVRDVKFSEDSSSSEDVVGERFFLDSCKEKGECSSLRRKFNGPLCVDLGSLESSPSHISSGINGPKLVTDPVIGSGLATSEEVDGSSTDEKLVKDTTKVVRSSCKELVKNSKSEIISSDNSIAKEEMVKVTIAAEELATRTAVQNLAPIVYGSVRIEMCKEVVSPFQGTK